MKTYNNTQDFINTVVIPYFIGAAHKNLASAIFDLDGKIIIATDLFAKYILAEKWMNIKGVTVFDIEGISEEAKVNFEKIRRKVIQKQDVVHYVNFYHYSYGFDAHLVSHFPIFMPNGTVAATRSVTQSYNLFNPVVCFNKFIKENSQLQTNQSNQEVIMQFTQLEYKVIFLITAGLTQAETALFLAVSRSKVAQILTNVYSLISVKSIPELIEAVINNKLITHMPDNFMKPRSMILRSISNNKVSI